VWWASTTSAHMGLLHYLDRRERARWATFRRCSDRARYLVAHALVRIVLAEHLGTSPAGILFGSDACRRCGEPHGKPHVLGDRRMEMSITHSGEMAGIAVGWSAPIGIDVEDLRRTDHGSLASAVLSSTERVAFGRIADAERHRSLLTYCTRKEALLKATGDGLTVPMRGLTVADPGRPARLVAWEDRPELTGRIRLHDLHPAAGHVASLAVIDADVTVTELWGDCLLDRAVAAGRTRCP
jgi:4'-phosphopantetheinyl transferase